MEELRKKLTTIKSEDIDTFSLTNLVTFGKVVELYDGDTCKIVLNINNNLQKFNCRLLGLDTPEMKPLLSKPNREQEILSAHKCRNRLLQLITNCECKLDSTLKKSECQKLLDSNNKIILVECHEFDKYGRLLVNLYSNETTETLVNKLLVDEGYAKSYDGGTKSIF